jgi:hypothetical protein
MPALATRHKALFPISSGCPHFCWPAETPWHNVESPFELSNSEGLQMNRVQCRQQSPLHGSACLVLRPSQTARLNDKEHPKPRRDSYSILIRVRAESRAEAWKMRHLRGVGSLVQAGVRRVDRPGRMATSLQPRRHAQPFRGRDGAGDPRRTGSFPRPFARQTGDVRRTRRRPGPRRRLDSKTCLRAEG